MVVCDRSYSLGENESDRGRLSHVVEVRAHDVEVFVHDMEARAESVFPPSHDVGVSKSDVCLLAPVVGVKGSDGLQVDNVVGPSLSDGSPHENVVGVTERARGAHADVVGEMHSVVFQDLRDVDTRPPVVEPHSHVVGVSLYVVGPNVHVESPFDTHRQRRSVDDEDAGAAGAARPMRTISVRHEVGLAGPQDERAPVA